MASEDKATRSKLDTSQGVGEPPEGSTTWPETADDLPPPDLPTDDSMAAGEDTQRLLKLLHLAYHGSEPSSLGSVGSDESQQLSIAEEPRNEGHLAYEAGTNRVGRFILKRRLGSGGFGVVWLAWDPQLGRDVALKVPRLETFVAAELRERFLNEAQAAAKIDHPNVVPVYEAGEAEGICYIVSAYCSGATLAEWLRTHADPVPFQIAAEVVRRLADAVEAGHRQGVLHRDLKPANVMLTPVAEGGSTASREALPFAPRLTDFGLAKLVDESLAATESSHMLGTPLYMAPEQFKGFAGRIGPAADIFGLGAILYELITQQRAFSGQTVFDVMEHVRFGNPMEPRQVRPGVPRDLETICLKCLEKDPKDRYASAAALAEDLHRFTTGAPIAAKPVSRWRRLTAWLHRHERIRDAGAYATIVNVAVPVWVIFNAVFFSSGYITLPAGTGTLSFLADSVAACTVHLPALWVARKTVQRRRWAVWTGTAISGLLLLAATAGLIGNNIMGFGTLYDDSILRMMVFCLLTVIFGGQLLAYLTAIFALRADYDGS